MTAIETKLLTAGDLFRLYSRGVRGELIRGVLCETMPTGHEHGKIVLTLGAALSNFVESSRQSLRAHHRRHHRALRGRATGQGRPRSLQSHGLDAARELHDLRRDALAHQPQDVPYQLGGLRQ